MAKLKAFTILESMVAIVIVMIVFSISSLVIVNVGSSGMTRKKQNAYALVKELRNKTILENRLIDESIEMNNLLIEKTILDYSQNNELKVLLIEAFDGKKKLFETKELVLID